MHLCTDGPPCMLNTILCKYFEEIRDLIFAFYVEKFRVQLLLLVSNYTTIVDSQNSQNKWTKISGIETNISELKMMVKNGVEFFILKLYQPRQSYLLTCQVNSAFLGRFFLHWVAATLNSNMKNSTPLFTIICNSKMLVSRPEVLVHLFKEFQVVWGVKKWQNSVHVVVECPLL